MNWFTVYPVIREICGRFAYANAYLSDDFALTTHALSPP